MSNTNRRQHLANRTIRVAGVTIAIASTVSIVSTIAPFNPAVADNPKQTVPSQNTTPLQTQNLKPGINRVTFQGCDGILLMAIKTPIIHEGAL
jgi:hypothetical protein